MLRLALLSANAGDDLSLWKILIGVVTFISGNVAVDLIRTAVRLRRLKSALLVDCLETYHKLNGGEFCCGRKKEAATDADDWQQIQLLPRGFIVGQPQIEAKELVTLLGEEQARLIVRFYERWDLFVAFEKVYTEVHAQLVAVLAACCTKGEEAADLRHMKEECWEQLKVTAEGLQSTADDLCGISLAIIRQFTWPSEVRLQKATEGNWLSWSALEVDADRFPKFRYPAD